MKDRKVQCRRENIVMAYLHPAPVIDVQPQYEAAPYDVEHENVGTAQYNVLSSFLPFAGKAEQEGNKEDIDIESVAGVGHTDNAAALYTHCGRLFGDLGRVIDIYTVVE